jgi:hypothetical protein
MRMVYGLMENILFQWKQKNVNSWNKRIKQQGSCIEK